MKHIKTFEIHVNKKELETTPNFKIGDDVVYNLKTYKYPMLKVGETYEVENVTWSKKKKEFVMKLKNVGNLQSFFPQRYFLSKIDIEIEKYNL